MEEIIKSEVDDEVAKIDRAMEQEGGKLSSGTIQTLRNVVLKKVSPDEVRRIYDDAIEDFNKTEQNTDEKIRAIRK